MLKKKVFNDLSEMQGNADLSLKRSLGSQRSCQNSKRVVAIELSEAQKWLH